MNESTMPTHEIAIHKIGGFFVTDRYSEGYTVNGLEAAALNQLVRENLRNNMAKKVEALQAKAKTESREPTEEELNALRTEFSSYEGTYTFASKRAPKAPVDPVQKEAFKIATTMATEALTKKGKKKTDLADGVFDSLVSQIVERNVNGVVDEAKRRVETTKAVAADSLGDLLGDLA